MAKETELDSLRAQNAALAAQNDQILDGLAAMQDEVAKLKAAQTGGSKVALQQQTVADELDAEWAKLRQEFSDLPNLEVLERRVLEGMDASTDIRLTDEPPTHEDPQGLNRRWKLRWFNLAKDGRAQQAAAEGYEKVEWAWLQNPESIAVTEKKDSYVRKGDKGLEVLYRTPLKFYEYKKRKDALTRQGKLHSVAAVREMVAEQVAHQAGLVGMNADQAGSFAHSGMSITVEPGQTERVTV